jgi:U3 small nucleolar RNA-associated protein 22
MLNGKPSSNGHKAARAPSHERDATGDTALPIKRRKLDDADAETVRPNNDSINHAEEAEATLMQLEVKELLAEVAVHQHTIDAVQSFVERLASTLRELPSSIVDPSPIRGLLSDFKFPTDRSFAFQPPQQVRLIGSFAINAASHPSSIADVAIVMPRSCFDDKDYLNHRYHAKRALYLSHVAAVLQARAERLGIADINWDVLRGDARRPTVVFKLQGADQQGGPGWCEVRLVPALVVGAFPFQKMAPEKNCLRSVNKRKKESESKATEDPAEPQLLPTPCYNATVIEDMLLVEHANLLAATAATAPCVSQAAVLLRVWGRQQCLFEGADGVSGFFLTMLMCHLVASGKVVS